jgi:hypothetical protein
VKSLSGFRSLGLAFGVAAGVLLSGSAARAQEPAPDAAPPGAAPAPAPSEAAPALPDQPPAPAAPPAPVPAAPAPADADADAAAAQAMADVTTAAQSESEGYRLNLYGFSDFTFTKYLDKGTFGPPVSTFAVGNLNLYAAAELGESWRALTEVRFTYLPNGAVPLAQSQSAVPPPPTDTAVPDYTEINRPIRWGGVIIERVYVERTFLSWLTVRAGQFLTPYGIWNVDHGSPVIIGVYRPYIIGENLFPRSQTGLEAFGSGLAGPVEVGYHLTLSNGRGPTDTYRDMDGNKAVGWRLWGRYRTAELGTLSAGFSGYRGKYTNANTVFGPDAKGNLSLTLQPTEQYDELAVAGDLKWERGGALVQSEFVMNERAYNDAARAPSSSLFGPPGFVPDHRRWGAYGLAGYRFSFLGIMPWGGGEYYNLGHQSSDVAAFWGGLNVRPTPRVVLKAQLTRAFFLDSIDGFKPKPMVMCDLQIAWSF